MAKRTPGDNKPSHPRDLYYPPRPADVAQASNMDALSDVQISGPSDNDFLVYDTASGIWTNQPIAAGDLPSHTHTEADISDLDHYNSADFDTDFAAKSTTDLPEGTNLYYTDVRADARISLAILDDLADVSLTSITANEVLVWQGTGGGSVWANKTLAELGAAELTGADFTGDVSVENTLTLEASGSGVASDLLFTSGGNSRWQIRKDAGLESGSNAGSNLDIVAFDDAGTAIATYLSITRSSGDVTIQSGSLAWGGGAAISSSDDVLTSSLTLGGISDVTVTTPSSGQVLEYDGSGWVNATRSLDDLNEVTLTTETQGDILWRDGGIWKNDDPTTAGVAELTGADFTGDVSVENTLTLEASGSGVASDLLFTSGGNSRWQIRKDAGLESGSNAGSNLDIVAFNDAGTAIATYLTINRASGDITTTGGNFEVQNGSLAWGGGAAISSSDDVPDLASNETVTGDWTFEAPSGHSFIQISGPSSGDHAYVSLQTNHVNRWLITKNDTAESGGHAGSDFEIRGYGDSGGFLGDYFTIERSSGNVEIPLGSLVVGTSLSWGGGSAIGDSNDVVQTTSSISALGNVNTEADGSIANREVLAWDSVNGWWENKTAAEANLAEAGHTHTASDVTDLDTLYPKNAQAETISANWTFSGSPKFTGTAVELENGHPILKFDETDGDEYWIHASGGSLYFDNRDTENESFFWRMGSSNTQKMELQSKGLALYANSDLNSKGDADARMWYGPSFNSDTTSITGTIAIKVPQSAVMHAIRVTLYNYNGSIGASQLLLGGYTYPGGPQWLNESATILSSDTLDDRFSTVRFVYKSGDGWYILIGDSSTTWYYPKIFVEMFSGYNDTTSPAEIGFYEAGVNAEPAWDDVNTVDVQNSIAGNRVPGIVTITSSTTAPSGSDHYGALHLIY